MPKVAKPFRKPGSTTFYLRRRVPLDLRAVYRRRMVSSCGRSERTRPQRRLGSFPPQTGRWKRNSRHIVRA